MTRVSHHSERTLPLAEGARIDASVEAQAPAHKWDVRPDAVAAYEGYE